MMLSRDTRMDAIRGIGVVLIVLVHVASPHFAAYANDWIPALAYGSIARPGVPLFLMLSGAFLLGGGRTYDFQVIVRRFPRYLVPLVFWSVIYGIWKIWLGEAVSVIGALLGKPVMYHLWYLYVAAGLLLTLPILACVVRAGDQTVGYFLCLWAVTMCVIVPIGAAFGVDGIDQLYGLATFSGYSGFMLLGAFIYDRRDRVVGTAEAWFGGLIISLLLLAVSTAWISSYLQSASEAMFIYTSVPVVASSVCLFVFLLTVRMPEALEHLLAKLGSVSLGVFGVHLLVMFFLWFFFALSVGSFSTWIGIPVMTGLIVAISAAISTLIRAVSYGKMVA